MKSKGNQKKEIVKNLFKIVVKGIKKSLDNYKKLGKKKILKLNLSISTIEKL
jgi:hypothetical protein